MSKTVEYILALKDQFSATLNQAHEKTELFNDTMQKTKGLAGEMMGALGISFAIFKGFEFVHQGVKAMHALEQAEAQVRAGLESTREAAGITFAELEDGAKAMAKTFAYTRAEITDMQAQLLTFPSVTRSTFETASLSIIDMSTRLHKSLDETAIMVGKALQDPAKGITALRRVGVNFNETQTEIIKRLAATGHAAQAQTMILKELQTEFAGSAKAAADADPLFRFNKLMGSIKMQVGEAAMSLLNELTPALEAVAGAIKTGISAISTAWHWIKEYKTQLLGLIEIIGIGIIAYKAWQAWQVLSYMWMMRDCIMTALSVSIRTTWATVTGFLTIAQTALNAAMDANPIGLLIIAIAAVVSIIVVCYKHFGVFRAALMGVWETVKEFGRIVGDIFMGVGKVIMGVLTLNPKMVVQGFEQTLDAISNAGNRLGHAFKTGYDDGIADFDKEHPIADPNAKAAQGPKAKPAVAPKPGPSTSPGNKVSGQRINTFYISINGGLAPHMTFAVTNIHESAGEIKEMVGKALTSAINDSQIIGNQ